MNMNSHIAAITEEVSYRFSQPPPARFSRRRYRASRASSYAASTPRRRTR